MNIDWPLFGQIQKLLTDNLFIHFMTIIFCLHSAYSILQGAGTAIGESPPYFMARAARLSGQIDEEEQEIEELLVEKKEHPSELVSLIYLQKYYK